MPLMAPVGAHLPVSQCDLDRTASKNVATITIRADVQKFAGSDRIDKGASDLRLTTFAEAVTGVNNVSHLFTEIDAISYEGVDSADRFVARQCNSTTFTAAGVGVRRYVGHPPAVPAVTILEGPENGH